MLEVRFLQPFDDKFGVAWHLAFDFWYFQQGLPGNFLAQSCDGALAWNNYPSSLSSVFMPEPILFREPSIYAL